MKPLVSDRAIDMNLDMRAHAFPIAGDRQSP
jgi:hypothetical protein